MYKPVWECKCEGEMYGKVNNFMREEFKHYLLTHLKFTKEHMKWIDRMKDKRVLSNYSESEMREAIQSFKFLSKKEFIAQFDRESCRELFYLRNKIRKNRKHR